MRYERKANHRDTETQRGLALSPDPAFLRLKAFARMRLTEFQSVFSAYPLHTLLILRQAQDEERVGGVNPLCLCVSVVIFSFVLSMGKHAALGRLGP